MVLPFVVDDDMYFAGGTATYVWAKHDRVGSVSREGFHFRFPAKTKLPVGLRRSQVNAQNKAT